MVIRLRILFFGILILLSVFGTGDLLAQVGCGGFDGAPQPTGGPQSITNGQICLNKPGAPAQIRISAFNVADGNNPNNFGVEIDWDDGSPRQIISFGGAITVNNTGPHAYDIPSITHVFLPRPCAARPGSVRRPRRIRGPRARRARRIPIPPLSGAACPPRPHRLPHPRRRVSGGPPPPRSSPASRPSWSGGAATS